MLDTKAPAAASGATRSRRSRAGLWVAVMAVLALAVYFIAAELRPHVYTGTVLQSPGPAPELGLTAHTGDTIEIDDFAGDIALIYFGYTQCPDLCPLTLSAAAEARKEMGDLGNRVHVMMVTVDPERDSPEYLGDFVTRFDPTFLGLSGTDEQLGIVTSLYGVWADTESATWDGGYLVDHTSTLMAVAPDGHLRLVYGPDVEASQLAVDLIALLES